MIALGTVEITILAVIFAFCVCGTIAHKAGYSRWFGLLVILPLVNVVLIWMFAYAKWPALAGDQADEVPK